MGLTEIMMSLLKDNIAINNVRNGRKRYRKRYFSHIARHPTRCRDVPGNKKKKIKEIFT